MKRLLSLLTMSLVLLSPFAHSADNYISDELFTYMHSGPGVQYRIIGSVNAGTPITRLKNSGNYTQIRDNRERTGWIETKYITSEPSLKIKFPALQAELITIKASLDKEKNDSQTRNQDLIDSLEQRTLRVQELEQHTNNLNQQLIDAQTEIRELRARIDTQKEDLLMRYFSYGGLVAGAGLLFGLVLPHVIPRRRKNNGWG